MENEDDTSMAGSEVEISPTALATVLQALQDERTHLQAQMDNLLQQLQNGMFTTLKTATTAPAPTQPQTCSNPPPASSTSVATTDNDVHKIILKQLLPRTFSGTGSDSPVDFIRAMESLIQVSALPFPSARDVMSSLLTGPASCWFRHNYASFTSTAEMLQSFRDEYLSSTVETSILSQIQAAKQSATESTVAFVDRVSKLYAALPTDKPQSEIVTQIIINARPIVSLHLGAKHASLGELRAAARRVDSLLPFVSPPPPTHPRPPNAPPRSD